MRHEGDELAARRETREVGDGYQPVADAAGEARYLLMRPLQKGLEQAELRHDVERRRMDRITAKVAQKVPVLFEQDRPHAGARKKQSGHHSGRTTPDDAAVVLRKRHRNEVL